MPKTNTTPEPSLCRCDWVTDDPLYLAYHDHEWGVPHRDDRHLFEMLVLEGAQAGLSWITILKKREGYRRLFENFDVEAVAAFDQQRIEELLQDASIVRNRLKVESAVANARAVLAVQAEEGSLSRYLWSFVDGQPIQNQWPSLGDVPPATDRSKIMSKELKKRGFRFVGPTVCYAFMQAVGMVNDHTVDCFRHGEVAALAGS